MSVTVLLPLHPRASLCLGGNFTWEQFKLTVVSQLSAAGVTVDLTLHAFVDAKTGRVLDSAESWTGASNLVSLVATQPIVNELDDNALMPAVLEHFVSEGLVYQEDAAEFLPFCERSGLKTFRDFKLMTKADVVNSSLSIGVRNRVLAAMGLKIKRVCVHPDCPLCAEVDTLTREMNEQKKPSQARQAPPPPSSPPTPSANALLEEEGSVEEIARRKTQMLSQAEMVIKGQRNVTKPVPREKLPDLQYEVIKINNIGRRQARILRLTDHEIMNMRTAQMCSSNHPYHDVFCVTLQDYKTFIIHYVNDHEYVYSSPIAGQIVTEINVRLVRQQNKEKDHLTTHIAKKPLRSHSDLRVRDSRDSKKKSSTSSVDTVASEHTDGHSDTEDEAKSRSDKDSVDEDVIKSRRVNVMEDPTTRDRLIGVLREGAMGSKKKADSKQSIKLQALTGLTEAQRKEMAIDGIILNPDTDVGRARATFLKNFSVYEKSPSTVLGVTRQFMDSLARYFEAKHADAIHAALRGSPESEAKDVELAIEKAVTMPIFRRVWDCLLKESSAKEEQLAAKLKVLRAKNQRFYGIKKEELSSNNWETAVYELSLLDKKIIPYEKLEVLLSTARAIYNSYNYEKNRRKVEKAKLEGDNTDTLPENFFLAADDFFPIFVFVVVNASVDHHDVSRQYLWGLCEASMLTGEGGYYLTVYEAAVEYIANFDLTKT